MVTWQPFKTDELFCLSLSWYSTDPMNGYYQEGEINCAIFIFPLFFLFYLLPCAKSCDASNPAKLLKKNNNLTVFIQPFSEGKHSDGGFSVALNVTFAS